MINFYLLRIYTGSMTAALDNPVYAVDKDIFKHILIKCENSPQLIFSSVYDNTIEKPLFSML